MAFFHDSRPQKQPLLNAPASVLWLIVAILAAHTVRALAGQRLGYVILDDFAFVPSHPANLPTYVTYLFVHGGYTHALVNSITLLAFGTPVAWRLGTARFLVFYFFCGIAAAIAHMLSEWGSTVPVLGASGAISGMIGGTLRLLYARPSMDAPGGGPPPLAPLTAKPVLVVSAVWMAANVVVGVLGIGLTEEGDLIAWVAHMGGFIAGLLTIGFFDPFSRARYPE